MAGLGIYRSRCVNDKARGGTIFRNLLATSVFAWYVAAQERGHQFNAAHTFNTTAGSCGDNRAEDTAYEPYSGSTIMGYRHACGDLGSTDNYFHNATIEQIVNYSNF